MMPPSWHDRYPSIVLAIPIVTTLANLRSDTCGGLLNHLQVDPFQPEAAPTGCEPDKGAKPLTATGRSRYGVGEPRKVLSEPPFQLRAPDARPCSPRLGSPVWGCLGAYWCDKDAYADYKVFADYFEHRLHRPAKLSGIRTNTLRVTQ